MVCSKFMYFFFKLFSSFWSSDYCIWFTSMHNKRDIVLLLHKIVHSILRDIKSLKFCNLCATPKTVSEITLLLYYG